MVKLLLVRALVALAFASVLYGLTIYDNNGVTVTNNVKLNKGECKVYSFAKTESLHGPKAILGIKLELQTQSGSCTGSYSIINGSSSNTTTCGVGSTPNFSSDNHYQAQILSLQPYDDYQAFNSTDVHFFTECQTEPKCCNVQAAPNGRYKLFIQAGDEGWHGSINITKSTAVGDEIGYECLPSRVQERPCIKNSDCDCKSLWNSDCDCTYWPFSFKEPATQRGGQCGSKCFTICKEEWQPHELQGYNITNIPCPVPRIKRYQVKIFYLAHGPYGTGVVTSWKEVLEVMGHSVDFLAIPLIKRKSGSALGYTSRHGTDEVLTALWEVCAMELYDKYHEWMPFWACLNLNVKKTGQVKMCAKTHNLDFNRLQRCYNGTEGKRLLATVIEYIKNYGVRTSPTVIMDGRTYNPMSERTATNYLHALCYVFDNPLKLFPWWVFGFISSVVIALAFVVFITKTWSAHNALYYLRNIVFFHLLGDTEGMLQELRDERYAVEGEFADADFGDEELPMMRRQVEEQSDEQDEGRAILLEEDDDAFTDSSDEE